MSSLRRIYDQQLVVDIGDFEQNLFDHEGLRDVKSLAKLDVSSTWYLSFRDPAVETLYRKFSTQGLAPQPFFHLRLHFLLSAVFALVSLTLSSYFGCVIPLALPSSSALERKLEDYISSLPVGDNASVTPSVQGIIPPTCFFSLPSWDTAALLSIIVYTFLLFGTVILAITLFFSTNTMAIFYAVMAYYLLFPSLVEVTAYLSDTPTVVANIAMLINLAFSSAAKPPFLLAMCACAIVVPVQTLIILFPRSESLSTFDTAIRIYFALVIAALSLALSFFFQNANRPAFVTAVTAVRKSQAMKAMVASSTSLYLASFPGPWLAELYAGVSPELKVPESTDQGPKFLRRTSQALPLSGRSVRSARSVASDSSRVSRGNQFERFSALALPSGLSNHGSFIKGPAALSKFASARIEHVALLSMDLIGYTAWCDSVSIDEVMASMHDLFSRFDLLLASRGMHGLHKLGDGYLAMSNRTDGVLELSIVASDCIGIFRDVFEGANDKRHCHEDGPVGGGEHVHRPVGLRSGIHDGKCLSILIGTLGRQHIDLLCSTVSICLAVESRSESEHLRLSLSALLALPTETLLALCSTGMVEPQPFVLESGISSEPSSPSSPGIHLPRSGSRSPSNIVTQASRNDSSSWKKSVLTRATVSADATKQLYENEYNALRSKLGDKLHPRIDLPIVPEYLIPLPCPQLQNLAAQLENIAALTITISSLYTEMRNPLSGLDIRTRRHLLRHLPECFVGSECVTWLMKRFKLPTRAEALTFAEQLYDIELIESVTASTEFCDGTVFYRFAESIPSSVVKFHRGVPVVYRDKGGQIPDRHANILRKTLHELSNSSLADRAVKLPTNEVVPMRDCINSRAVLGSGITSRRGSRRLSTFSDTTPEASGVKTADSVGATTTTDFRIDLLQNALVNEEFEVAFAESRICDVNTLKASMVSLSVLIAAFAGCVYVYNSFAVYATILQFLIFTIAVSLEAAGHMWGSPPSKIYRYIRFTTCLLIQLLIPFYAIEGDNSSVFGMPIVDPNPYDDAIPSYDRFFTIWCSFSTVVSIAAVINSEFSVGIIQIVYVVLFILQVLSFEFVLPVANIHFQPSLRLYISLVIPIIFTYTTSIVGFGHRLGFAVDRACNLYQLVAMSEVFNLIRVTCPPRIADSFVTAISDALSQDDSSDPGGPAVKASVGLERKATALLERKGTAVLERKSTAALLQHHPRNSHFSTSRSQRSSVTSHDTPVQIEEQEHSTVLRKFLNSNLEYHEVSDGCCAFLKILNLDKICDSLIMEGGNSGQNVETVFTAVSLFQDIINSVDSILEGTGVVCIKWFGSTAVFICGAPSYTSFHLPRLVIVVLAIIDAFRAVNIQLEQICNTQFSVTCGIDVGPLVGMPVISNSLEYDVLGDTINTAARMNASAPCNHCQVSSFGRTALMSMPLSTSRIDPFFTSKNVTLLKTTIESMVQHEVNVKGKGVFNTVLIPLNVSADVAIDIGGRKRDNNMLSRA